MRLLITGSKGQLGWELCRQGQAKDMDIVPLDLPEFDITNKDDVQKIVLQSNPDMIINAAAYTAVDKAESEPDIAFAVNRDGPAHLASVGHSVGIPLIHISTDYVFDGNKEGLYLETDTVSPLGVYGRSKAAGEEEIRNNLKEHVIIRTSWLCGVHGNNFVKTMLRLGKDREEIGVVNDQHGCPTFAEDLGRACLTIAEECLNGHASNPWGTYHFCGKGSTTWWGFASKIFELSKQYESCCVEKVMPISTAEYPTPAKRPKNSKMDYSALMKKFGIEPPAWEDSLCNMIVRLIKENKE